MGADYQKVRVPLLERLALLDLAERRGQSEEETLQSIIREAVRAECLRPEPCRLAVGPQSQEVGDG